MYHSAMQHQPAIGTTWKVPLGYFFAEYSTGWNRLYENMTLAEMYSVLYIIAPDSDS